MAEGHWLLRPTWWGGRSKHNDDIDRCGNGSSPGGSGHHEHGDGGPSRRVLDRKYITSLFDDASDEALSAAMVAIADIQRKRQSTRRG